MGYHLLTVSLNFGAIVSTMDAFAVPSAVPWANDVSRHQISPVKRNTRSTSQTNTPQCCRASIIRCSGGPYMGITRLLGVKARHLLWRVRCRSSTSPSQDRLLNSIEPATVVRTPLQLSSLWNPADLEAPVEVPRTLPLRDKVMELLRPEVDKMLLSTIWAMVGTTAALSIPLCFAGVYSAILDPALASGRLSRSLGILGVLYIVEPVATVFFVRIMSGVAERAAVRLRVEAMRSILAQEIAFFDMKGFTKVTSAVTSDVREIKSALQSNLQRDRGLRAILESTFGLMILLKLSPQLAWIFFMVVPAIAWGLAESRKRLAAMTAEEGKSLGREAAISAEAVRNIRSVRSFGTEGRELSRFQSVTQETSAQAISIGASTGKLEALNRAAIYLSIISVVTFGVRQIVKGSMDAPLLVSFVGFCYSINFAMQGVNFTIADAKRGVGALQRVLDVMEPAGHVACPKGLDVIPPEKFEGRVDFCRVHFRYPTRPDVPVFTGLQLGLPAGKVTALVGPSGGGKSTIVALLSRFYQPDQGEILLDGVNVQDLDRRWLTRHVALVGQNPALFTGTIAQNIVYGVVNPDPDKADCELQGTTMEEVAHAAELANAKEFIEDFPEGYNTFVGEGGVQLSGGQRQRIAIARAILKNAPILVLDE
ncbi:unnamed protein product, partial [Choristocarpus tenellus]